MLGSVVSAFGVLVAVVGTVIGLLVGTYIGFFISLGVLLLGVLTWVFPFVHLSIRVNKAKTLIEQHIKELATLDNDKP